MSQLKRRDFIIHMMRLSLSGGLIGTGIYLTTRKPAGQSESLLCRKTSPCRQCGQFGVCTQPRALAENQKQQADNDSTKIVM